MEVNSHFKAVLRLTYGTYITEYKAQLLVKHASDYNRNTTEGTQENNSPPDNAWYSNTQEQKYARNVKRVDIANREQSR
jgi:hypothetical protein